MPRRAADARRTNEWMRAHDHVAAVKEALAAGISRKAQEHLVATRQWRRMGHAVLVDGAVPATPELVVRVALAQAGDDAVASHLTAGGLWGMLDRLPGKPHITVGVHRRMRSAEVVVHQTAIGPERSRCRGIPVTSASRTLLDLAAMAAISPQTLGRCLDRALELQITAVPRLVEMVDRWPSPRCRGGPRLLRTLELGRYVEAPEASALERRTMQLLAPLCRAEGLPEPCVEHRVLKGRYRLDFAWPALKLAVEVDGYLWHSSPEAMARDLARRNELANRGWLVLVFTWHQVVCQPEDVAASILAAISARAVRI